MGSNSSREIQCLDKLFVQVTGRIHNSTIYVQTDEMIYLLFAMVIRTMKKSLSPPRSIYASRVRAVGGLTLAFCSWLVIIAVAAGFQTCPIACTRPFRTNNEKINVVGGRRIGRILYNRMSMVGDDDCGLGPNTYSTGMLIHHTAVKTRNITTAIQFYSLLGFQPIAKFKAGPARAAWLQQEQQTPSLASATKNTTIAPSSSSISRIELIEVPPWILQEPEGMKRRAIDLFENQAYLGHNHLALDVTSCIEENKEELESSPRNHTFLLSAWMDTLNEKSLRLFRKTLRVALEAEQFMVGNVVYERAFIYDADGALIELLHKAAELPQSIDPTSGWEIYDFYEDDNKPTINNEEQ